MKTRITLFITGIIALIPDIIVEYFLSLGVSWTFVLGAVIVAILFLPKINGKYHLFMRIWIIFSVLIFSCVWVGVAGEANSWFSLNLEKLLIPAISFFVLVGLVVDHFLPEK